MSEKTTEDGYGIKYLAEQLEMSPQNVRNALRRLKVAKNDSRYSWSRKSEADAVVKRIETETNAGKAEKPAAKPTKKTAKDEAPAKTTKATSKAAEKASERRASKKAAADDKPAKKAKKNDE